MDIVVNLRGHAVVMANDHFVAQTYLKHFGDPSKGGMLHAYRKPCAGRGHYAIGLNPRSIWGVQLSAT